MSGGTNVTKTRSIYLVDDDSQIRKALTFLLKASGYVVRASSGGRSFLADVPHLSGGCVLLDMNMPDLNGLQVIEALGSRIKAFPVVMMTGHGDIATAVTAMKMGASDYLEKPFSANLLSDTLALVFEALDAGQAEQSESETAVTRVARLSMRERDVMRGLAAGYSNKIIAYRLNLSTRTVEMYRASMMDSLQVKSLPEAMRLAFLAGVSPGIDDPQTAAVDGGRLRQPAPRGRRIGTSVAAAA